MSANASRSSARPVPTPRQALLVAAVVIGLPISAAFAEPIPLKSATDARSVEFFERYVRPVLLEHCGECHGAAKQEADLRLDLPAAIAQGTTTAPILVPGQPFASRLIQVINCDDDVQMPPKGRLPQPTIDILVKWVKDGASLPDEMHPVAKKSAGIPEGAGSHWAFQPVRPPAIPKTRSSGWADTPIDAFVLARLEAAGLQSSPPADRGTLIRRVALDLHGLPPTFDEVAQFEADARTDAFARLVDRLLASPRYGERWGRYWLDVARYSDTKGYVRLNENPSYTCSWTYRDYVIRAFNEDLPYDRFILEQLAADQLTEPSDPRPLAALGFLTLGQRFLNSQHDIIDDRIDVVTRGLMGLTVSCARCHDHKFDPIPTREYYGLHGVFASSIEPRVPVLLLPRGNGSAINLTWQNSRNVPRHSMPF